MCGEYCSGRGPRLDRGGVKWGDAPATSHPPTFDATLTRLTATSLHAALRHTAGDGGNRPAVLAATKAKQIAAAATAGGVSGKGIAVAGVWSVVVCVPLLHNRQH